MSERRAANLDAATDRLQAQLGAAVRRLREVQGLTQEHLANASGLATRHIQKIEGGQVNVTLRTLCSLGIALGVDLSVLLASPKSGDHR